MNPEVSIIIPVFNKDEYLDDCLESVLNQSFRQLEVICIDDASTDKSSNILTRYEARDSRLRVIKNKKNLGAGISRNIGIQAATGKYFRFVDADDLLPQNTLAKLYDKAFEANADLVKGSLAIFQDDAPADYIEPIRLHDKKRAQFVNEKQLWTPWWHQSYLISSDLVLKNDIRYPDLIVGEDPVFLALVLINAKNLTIVEDIVYLYRRYQKKNDLEILPINYALDYIKHAYITKKLFCSVNPDLWNYGYGPFLLDDMQAYMKRFEFTSSQKYLIQAKLEKIWSSHIINI